MATERYLNASVKTQISLEGSALSGVFVEYKDSFGEDRQKNLQGSYLTSIALAGIRGREFDFNGLMSTGVLLDGSFIEATGYPDPVVSCGSLIFSRECSSQHIVTIGL